MTSDAARRAAEKVVDELAHDATVLNDSSYIASFGVLPSRVVDTMIRFAVAVVAEAVREERARLFKTLCPACGMSPYEQIGPNDWGHRTGYREWLPCKAAALRREEERTP